MQGSYFPETDESESPKEKERKAALKCGACVGMGRCGAGVTVVEGNSREAGTQWFPPSQCCQKLRPAPL